MVYASSFVIQLLVIVDQPTEIIEMWLIWLWEWRWSDIVIDSDIVCEDDYTVYSWGISLHYYNYMQEKAPIQNYT